MFLKENVFSSVGSQVFEALEDMSENKTSLDNLYEVKL
jgi:hypothetical protein